jgi:methanogenic corrinoid protein MtbC1/DNA-binding XRE family transcriptional regulator
MTHKHYLEAITSGNKALAAEIVDQALVSGAAPLDLYFKMFMPAQRELGKLWFEKKITIAEEHRSTEITLEQMGRVRTCLKPHRQLKQRIAVVVAQGDLHQVGARVVADLFWAEGWQVDFLGANTPNQETLRFVRENNIELLAISITLSEFMPQLRELLEAAHALVPRPIIMVGGGEWLKSEVLPHINALAVDALHAVSEAKRLLGSADQETLFAEYLQQVGTRIQALRKKQGLSQHELSTQCNLDRAYLSAVENGKQNVSLSVLWRLADALKTPLENLLSTGMTGG